MTTIVAWLAACALLTASPVAAESEADPLNGNKINAVIDRYNFSGDVVAIDPDVPDGTMGYGYFGLLPEPAPHEMDGLEWRWASITKQVIAVIVMQEVEAGRIDLDASVNRYLPKFASANAASISVRQLLRHQSGLPNPDDTKATREGIPAYYGPGGPSRDPLTGFCASTPKGKPGGNWEYNNCDYIVAGALLESVAGKTWQNLVQERIAKPLNLNTLRAFPAKRWVRWGKINGKREPKVDLAAYAASGALYGSAEDLMVFDMALMAGKLLKPETLAVLWDGRPELGFIALGQWVFEAPLRGCDAPVRIVERRGAIGGVEIRNFMIPERKIALAAFSDSAPFDFGEIWQGSGFSHDLLSAAVCGA